MSPARWRRAGLDFFLGNYDVYKTIVKDEQHQGNACPLCAEHERAERLLLSALESLLNNWALDITFINQRDLNARGILRDGVVDRGAVLEFAEALRREFASEA